MMKRIITVLITAALLMTGCAAGGSSDVDSETGLKELDVVLDWYPNALHSFLYVAMEKGYFEEEGLKINIRFPSNTNDAISLVAAGQADIGLYYQQDVIQARAEQGIPVKSIGAIVKQPLNIVLSLKEKNITKAEDLVGKTVGYAGTELSEAIVKCIMESAGKSYDDVTMVDVGFDLMSSMTTGNVDATIGCFLNHEVPQMEEEGFEVNYMEFADYGVPSYYDNVFLASDRAIAEDAETLKAFLRACEKGFVDMKSNPEEALEILLKNQNEENFPLSESVERKSMEILLEVMETEEEKFLLQTDACWQENIDWMTKQGLIECEITLDDVRVNLEF
ncbi:MAG: ABC transporter substrate-binding protein [Schaedlerella sp.]|nr:ABC transporter substrate-binding protein [Schaedlerella sp.]